MNPYSLFNSLYDPYPLFGQSVYVISDSDFAKHKRAQIEREVAELEKLQASHQASIDRLQATIDKLRADLPDLDSPKETAPPA